MTAPLVFITGASSGIGQALALRFHQGGYRLALVARRTSEMKSWTNAQQISADSYEIYSAYVSVPESIMAAGQDCIARQGLPDVVIANAGISVGMDTAVRADIDVMARTFATNNIGMAATLPAVCGRHGATPVWHPGGYRQCGGHPRLARAWCVLRQQGGGHQLLREPAWRNAPARGARGDHFARLYRYAAHAPEPLRHAIPDAGR